MRWHSVKLRIGARKKWPFAALIMALSSLGAAQVSLVANAQQTNKLARLGYLNSHTPERFRIDVFRDALRQFGWFEGHNLVIHYRSAQGDSKRLPDLAKELVGLDLDAIVAVNTVSALAAKRATQRVPIIFKFVSDPLGSGLIVGLARPGGNITGFTHLNAGLMPKRLEFFRQLVPEARMLAAIWHPGGLGERTETEMLKETEDAARAFGFSLRLRAVRDRDDLDDAFAAMNKERVGALVVLPSPLFLTEQRRVVALAAKYRVPTAYFTREFVEIGGLIAYGANIDEMVRGAARYVDKILRGANPANLPVEQSTKFELAINLKTARSLGVTLSPALLARADELIE
jgi:putative tryptophan/tyrosine transport system substrate-binding protein